MTYQELATRLLALGKSLQEHSSRLSGESTAKIAKTLGENTDKLDRIIQSAIHQSAPEAVRLREALESNERQFPVAQLQSLGKKLGLKIPGGQKVTPAGTRSKFVELAVAGGVSQKAADLVEAFVRVQKEGKPDTSTEEKLRAELRRLGAKSAEEIEFELEGKFSDSQARDLAKAAGLKVTKSASKKSLIPKIIHYARRHYENTAMNLQVCPTFLVQTSPPK
jgi:hypothetical protein